jgi:4'-phosphopantetheinyl transferase
MGHDRELASVFLCRPDSVTDVRLIRDYERLLNPIERVRLGNFRLGRDAHAFLVAHALLRAALSYVYDVPPEGWRLRVGQWGRPEAECGGYSPGFSLSHTNGLIACIVATDRSCGVDVEELRAFEGPLELASGIFAPSELAQMRNLSDEHLLERFYSLWTLKEAYLKARGAGLMAALDVASFDWDGDRIIPSFKDERTEASSQWTFTLRKPTLSHVLATALAGAPPAAASDIPVHWLVPLLGLQTFHQTPSTDLSA